MAALPVLRNDSTATADSGALDCQVFSKEAGLGPRAVMKAEVANGSGCVRCQMAPGLLEEVKECCAIELLTYNRQKMCCRSFIWREKD
jgi:hypothetical protein